MTGEEDYAEMFKSMKKKKKKSSKKTAAEGDADAAANNEEEEGAELVNAIEKENDSRYASVSTILALCSYLSCVVLCPFNNYV